MKVLQKILFTLAVGLCLSLAVSAQRTDDEKKKPPKPPPPVINPGEGKKPPKNDDKPKKPTSVFIVWKGETFAA